MKITKHIRYIRIVLMSGINSNFVREAIVVYVCWGIAKGVSPAPPAAILPSLHYQDASLLLLLLFFPLLMPIIRDSITGIKERERGPPCPLLLFHRDLAWVQKAFFYPLPPLPLRLVCLCTSSRRANSFLEWFLVMPFRKLGFRLRKGITKNHSKNELARRELVQRHTSRRGRGGRR